MDPNVICSKCNIAMKAIDEEGEVYLVCGICRLKKEYKDWITFHCPECGYDKAIIVVNMQTLGDEDWTTILRCIRCSTTVKEGFKG